MILTMARLALLSAWNRRLTLSMIIISMAFSVALLLGVDRLGANARSGFSQSVSGTDLVIGARTGPVQLMLYAVFHLGNATNNISWASFKALQDEPSVAWAIPISLGDSHKGFPVLATNADYFKHFSYGEKRHLSMAQGKTPDGIFDVVPGAEVATRLGYKTGDRIVLTHGLAQAGPAHADKPFTVTGILARTGTPVDRTLHITLAGMEAIHLDWAAGAPLPGVSIPAQYASRFDLAPKTITAMLVGLKNRAAVFRMQRFVNAYPGEPLLAVLPGVVLADLWHMAGMVETTLLAISAMVVATGLAGLIATLLAGLNERRRELAILRAIGASPRHIFCLLLAEGVAISILGMAGGLVLLSVLTTIAGPLLQAHFGLHIEATLASLAELRYLAVILAMSTLTSLIPGWQAYRLSLADGLSPRL